MNSFAEIRRDARFAWGLRDFLGHPISLEEAKAIIKQRLEKRETNFLLLVKGGIFGNPKSPYLPLLKLAHCEMGDIENMVRIKGIEETLRTLRESGVYFTFEEFKGRMPVVRHGHTIQVKPRDFDNPYLTHYYEGKTGGTTGAGARVTIDLDYLADNTPFFMLTQEAHGFLDAPIALWYGLFPDSSALGNILICARYGRTPQKWFSPVTNQQIDQTLKERLVTQSIIGLGRLFGASIPRPVPVSLDNPIPIVRWAVETIKIHGRCVILSQVSRSLRICIAAREAGVELSGAVLWGGGEPPTPSKVREMTRVGARFVPRYWFTEAGCVGQGCVHPADSNDLHFTKDTLALIQYPREIAGSGITVDAFQFTTLLPSCPKIMLNVESDDYGLIETRSCGCPLESYGLTEHLRYVRSFGKLTGEAVTLVGSEMVHILEEVLPARFGGSPLDYQLLEEEDEKGFTRLNLLVSPKIKIVQEKEVIDAVLEALDKSSGSGHLTRVIWGQAATLRVKRMDPVWTARGKFMPLHLVRKTDSRSEKK